MPRRTCQRSPRSKSPDEAAGIFRAAQRSSNCKSSAPRRCPWAAGGAQEGGLASMRLSPSTLHSQAVRCSTDGSLWWYTWKKKAAVIT